MPSVTKEKIAYEERLNKLLDTYSKVYFVQVDNVTSQQMHNVRRGLRGKGELLMGKNTLQKKVITMRAGAEGASNNDKAIAEKFVKEGLISGNCGLIFTNDDLATVMDVITKNRIQAPARIGAVSPVDVIIPAGNTGLEPTMTSFFQALNIATKIAKGTVEIVADKQVLKVGDKVDSSTAALLTKLKINPFFYGLQLRAVWDDGVVFSAEDLEFDDSKIEEVFSSAIGNMTALSLGAGIPTAASFPHLISDAFKNLLAASVVTDYEFPEFGGKDLKKAIKEGKVGGGAAPAAAAAGGKAAAAAPAAAAKQEEPEDDDDFDGLGGLF
jgi:large subunit ribosomal protein LP0